LVSRGFDKYYRYVRPCTQKLDPVYYSGRSMQKSTEMQNRLENSTG